MMVAMMEMAVAVRAGGARLVMYCMMDTHKMFIPIPSKQLVKMRM